MLRRRRCACVSATKLITPRDVPVTKFVPWRAGPCRQRHRYMPKVGPCHVHTRVRVCSRVRAPAKHAYIHTPTRCLFGCICVQGRVPVPVLACSFILCAHACMFACMCVSVSLHLRQYLWPRMRLYVSIYLFFLCRVCTCYCVFQCVRAYVYAKLMIRTV